MSNLSQELEKQANDVVEIAHDGTPVTLRMYLAKEAIMRGVEAYMSIQDYIRGKDVPIPSEGTLGAARLIFSRPAGQALLRRLYLD